MATGYPAWKETYICSAQPAFRLVWAGIRLMLAQIYLAGVWKHKWVGEESIEAPFGLVQRVSIVVMP